MRRTCWEENLPQSTEATYASWLMQLRLSSRCWLLPACVASGLSGSEAGETVG